MLQGVKAGILYYMVYYMSSDGVRQGVQAPSRMPRHAESEDFFWYLISAMRLLLVLSGICCVAMVSTAPTQIPPAMEIKAPKEALQFGTSVAMVGGWLAVSGSDKDNKNYVRIECRWIRTDSVWQVFLYARGKAPPGGSRDAYWLPAPVLYMYTGVGVGA